MAYDRKIFIQHSVAEIAKQDKAAQSVFLQRLKNLRMFNDLFNDNLPKNNWDLRYTAMRCKSTRFIKMDLVLMQIRYLMC